MSILTTLLNPPALPAASAWTDVGWWGSAVGGSAAGVSVSPETALKVSTVWACTGLIAETVGMLPLITYRYLAGGGREPARDHPLYQVLHSLPNEQQTAIEFREMLTGHLLLRGNAYARIVAGPRGFADQLVPLHPDQITPELLPDGRLRYRLAQPVAGRTVFTDAEILHLRGRSSDGKVGMSVVAYARESLGLALAAEAYGARYFGNGSQPAGVLKTPGKLDEKAAKKLKASWEASHTGSNQHRVAVLEDGLEWQALGMSNKDSQFLELREFTAEDVCRWFRVPPHMVGLTSKSTSWGSGLEEMGQGFVTYTLLPWLTRWTQAITRDLILAPQAYFVDFVVDALLKGRTIDRYNAYAIARDKGWLSINDVRQLENMNPIPDGDTYNTGAASPVGAHYRQLVHEAAGRIARKETAALTRAAKRTAGSDWSAAVDEFYHDHAEFVAETLCISADMAAGYVATWSGTFKQLGPEPVAESETRRVADLVDLVLEER